MFQYYCSGLFLLFQCLLPVFVYAAPPEKNYYLIALNATLGATISNSDDVDSGVKSCTLRDALDIVTAGALPLNSPSNGCLITLIGDPPASPVYRVNLPPARYTYTLINEPGNELEIFNNTVFIVGNNPASTIIQAADSAANAKNRVLGLFQATVEISNTTLRHGHCAVSSGNNIFSCGQNEFRQGGGILVRSNSTLTLDNVRVLSNQADFRGGGIYTTLNSVLNVLNGSMISDNVIDDGGSSGGGIHINSSGDQVLIDASIVSNNSAGESASAGGIHNSGTLTIQNGSVISGNVANRNGGGIANGFAAKLTVDNSTVKDNVSGGNGGGIYSSGQNSSVEIINNSQIGISGEPNQALVQGNGGRGGGIFNDFLSTLTIDNSSVSFNEANSGGGIANIAFANLNNFSLISNNDGGGILNSGLNAQLTINSSFIKSNFFSGAFATGGGIANQSGATLTIENASVIGGPDTGNTANSGGGIANNGAASSITIDASEVSGNQAFNGGGIHNANGGTITAQAGSQIGTADAPNAADGVGGGVYNTGTDSEFTLDNSSISHNVAVNNGGGLFNEEEADAFIENGSQIDNNQTLIVPGFDGGGGGIYNEASDARVFISDSSMSGNSSADKGGAIYNGSPTFSESTAIVTINNTAFMNNEARFAGGAIRNRSIGTGDGSTVAVAITNGQFSGNNGGDAGGAISNEAQSKATALLTLDNSTLGSFDEGQANTARHGGGIHNLANGSTASAALTLRNNTIIAGNTADAGGGIWNQTTFSGAANLIISSTNIMYNQAADGDGGGLYNVAERGTTTLTIDTNSRVSNNQASVNGGGIFSDAGTESGDSIVMLTINDSELRHNAAIVNGGAIYHTQQDNPATTSTIELLRNAIEFNDAVDGDGIYHNGGTTLANRNCFVANGVGFFNNTAIEQQAQFSWWGLPDGPDDADGLSGATGSGDGVTQFVDFSNFITGLPDYCAGQIFAEQFENPE